uniref:Uncharacterized protein n=1 Tax=Anguilla anguilla TaxID=7936 RepID=A0A0E9SB40_ANGAN
MKNSEVCHLKNHSPDFGNSIRNLEIQSANFFLHNLIIME